MYFRAKKKILSSVEMTVFKNQPIEIFEMKTSMAKKNTRVRQNDVPTSICYEWD